jgi:hypothetical protein
MSSQGYKDLIVYKKAYSAAMAIHKESKSFPKEETYSLTDQVHLDFAKDCGYVSEEAHKLMTEEYLQIGKKLGSMMSSPEKFSVNKKLPTAPAN